MHYDVDYNIKTKIQIQIQIQIQVGVASHERVLIAWLSIACQELAYVFSSSSASEGHPG